MPIKLQLQDPRYFNDVGEVARIFFGDVEIVQGEPEGDELCILQQREVTGDTTRHIVTLMQGSQTLAKRILPRVTVRGDALTEKKYFKRGLKIALFRMLRDHTGQRVPWGSLTGIRPTKLAYELRSMGWTDEGILVFLQDEFDVELPKARLVLDVLHAQEGLIDQWPRCELDVYIGIPFCNTRCVYCSFSAEALSGKRTRVTPYLQALHQELEQAGRHLMDMGWRVRSLYVGGGTPTSLTTEELEEVLAHASRVFPGEYERTVEAGRPDTINEGILQAMRRQRVNRISINPQSMHDRTLQMIGRGHSAADIPKAFQMARQAGFDSINMDVIAGLPGETPEMMRETLDKVAALNPENLTVHTLAIKRASRLRENLDSYRLPGAQEVEDMVHLGNKAASDLGMRPYYLYRQKYMTGSLENVGYAKPGSECLYNIDVMEETHTVLALGAGAISKCVYPEENRIERQPNAKNIAHYIEHVDEIIQKKSRFFDIDIDG